LFDDLAALYAMSGIFGLFNGGLIPLYAVTVREYFSPHEAGARVGIVIGATLLGMALGGWMSGAIFDLTASYRATFINAVIWNLFNLISCYGCYRVVGTLACSAQRRFQAEVTPQPALRLKATF
jgi:MFS family permease